MAEACKLVVSGQGGHDREDNVWVGAEEDEEAFYVMNGVQFSQNKE